MKTNSQQSLKRGLKNRHLQMIALGGAIGTGLFYGSASTIQLAGPAISLSYLIGGCVIFFIMRMLGEMAVDNPVSGSFSSYANTYWHEFVGFLSGWNYWMNYVIVSMVELTAVGIYINYWLPDVPQWLSALICLIIITVINLINVKLYGEFATLTRATKQYLIFTTDSGATVKTRRECLHATVGDAKEKGYCVSPKPVDAFSHMIHEEVRCCVGGRCAPVKQ